MLLVPDCMVRAKIEKKIEGVDISNWFMLFVVVSIEQKYLLAVEANIEADRRRANTSRNIASVNALRVGAALHVGSTRTTDKQQQNQKHQKQNVFEKHCFFIFLGGLCDFREEHHAKKPFVVNCRSN